MNPLQKAAVRRKLFYFAAILALFTISIFYRGLEAKTAAGESYVWLPLGGDDRAESASFGSSLARKTIVSQSQRLELRELDEGEPDLAGEAVRLMLLGSRGFAVTFTWWNAIEEQKRNDFHKFERSIKAVTTLQPHFITPWIFQSWNIAYNVSVEMQSLGDMYFYIARGIDLLAEGERRNRRSPDMRYQIAFYYQMKFGVADQVQTLRCLFQLSCIPPDGRNPQNLLDPDGSVNLEAFKKFCQDHPMLVRRLRGEERQDNSKTTSEALRTRTPENVVQFLRDNRAVPSRYKNATELFPADRQFPVLPPQFNEGPDEANPRNSAADLGERFSGYLAARAWFAYSNILAPPNPKDSENHSIPSGVPTDYDQFKYRMPRLPALILFRQGAPRAQSYQAEMMQKDGWFDEEGWKVDGGTDQAWFKEPLVVGAGTPWSRVEWQKAYDIWSKHGTEYGLKLPANQLNQLRLDAGIQPGVEFVPMPPEPTMEQMANEAFARCYRAQQALFYYYSNRSLTNFAYYLAVAEGEQQKETVEARKILWKADQLRRLGVNVKAAELYRSGLEKWRSVLARNPNFHRTEQLKGIEEQTCEYELEYLRLIASNDPLVRKKALEEYLASYQKTAHTAAGVIPFGVPGPAPKAIPDTIRDAWYADTAGKFFSPFAGTITAQDVGSGDPRINTPWIQASVRETTLYRQDVKKPQAPAGGKSAPPNP